EGEADLAQGERRARRRKPGAAHHRPLGIAGELSQHVERADQHPDRKELVGVRRRRQQHVGEDLAQLVFAGAKVPELLDEIEEREESKKAQQHEADGAVDLACEVALYGAQPRGAEAAGPHRPSRRRISCMRRANMKSRSATIPACTSHRPMPKSMRPCATRAWLTRRRVEYTM